MKSQCATRISSILFGAFAAVALTSVTSPLLLAQQPPKPSPNRPTFYPSPSGTDIDRQERDRHFRDLEMIDKVISKEKPKSNERDREIALREATEDFQRLVEINQQPLVAVGVLDYKPVFETMCEVEKRATRLKANLVLPVIVADKKKKSSGEIDENNFKAVVSDLKQLLTNFLNNPVFYGNGSIDAKLQMQAARDLDGVIELSRRVSISAEKLDNRTGKPK